MCGTYCRVGEGDWKAAAIFTAGTAFLCALVWKILSRSFLSIATAGGTVGKVRYVEKPAKQVETTLIRKKAALIKEIDELISRVYRLEF